MTWAGAQRQGRQLRGWCALVAETGRSRLNLATKGPECPGRSCGPVLGVMCSADLLKAEELSLRMCAFT